MGTNFWITFLQARIREAKLPDAKGLEFYLFGSCLRKIDPADVDLLVIYDPSVKKIEVVVSIRRYLKETLEPSIGKPLHICLLSENEVRHTHFVQQEKCVKLNL
jgi:predicted nucleotidyltransferase